jgi:hypothetical protein
MVLLALVLKFRFEAGENKRELARAYEAIRACKDKRSAQSRYISEALAQIGEARLETSDTIPEAHRISGYYGSRAYVLRFELRNDSSLVSVFKSFTLKNPLTGEGETKIFENRKNPIDISDFQTFKYSLHKLSLSEVAVEESNLLCCFGGGSISWEAVMPDKKRYRFSTYCRQSVQFAEICEKLLEKCGVFRK